MIAQVDNIVAGMDAYVLEKVFEDYKLAVANLFAALEDEDNSIKAELSLQASSIDGVKEANATLTTRVDGAEANINLNAQNIGGVASSVATIQADVVELKGRIDLSGNVSVSDGQLTVLGNLVAKKSFQIGSDSFYIAGKKYTPTPITSTSGAVMALGTA